MKNGVLKGIFAAFRVCMMLLFCIKTEAQFTPSWGGARDFAAKEALALGKEALQGFDHVLTGDANIKNFPWYVELLYKDDRYESFGERILYSGAKRIVNNLPASIYGSSIIKAIFVGQKCIDSMSNRIFCFSLNVCFFPMQVESVIEQGKKRLKEVFKHCVSSACSQASGYAIGRVAGAVAPKSLVDKAVLLHIPLFIPAIIRTNAHVVKWFDIKLDLRKVPGFSRVDKNNKFVNNAQIKVMPLLSGMVHGFNASAQARLSA